MSRTSQEIRLAARPQGRPDASTWELATTEVAEPGPGEFLVQLQQISLDPAMRGWLNDVRSYLPPVQIGAVMRAFGAGTVVASQHDDFAVGDVVSGTFGVREYAISDGKGVARLDLDVTDSRFDGDDGRLWAAGAIGFVRAATETWLKSPGSPDAFAASVSTWLWASLPPEAGAALPAP